MIANGMAHVLYLRKDILRFVTMKHQLKCLKMDFIVLNVNFALKTHFVLAAVHVLIEQAKCGRIHANVMQLMKNHFIGCIILMVSLSLMQTKKYLSV